MQNFVKIGQTNSFWDIAIFCFSKWPPSTILDFTFQIFSCWSSWNC